MNLIQLILKCSYAEIIHAREQKFLGFELKDG